ncbi:hypothetical protein [Myroides sp. WP-1]|uniref:hypothetical protein n=1 Tax=Myroides sp. WP-1 TaxID=2759944 RepID=UPI0015FAED79|nr:hypothetical protein [Myroides sp. WP-1]MBB1139094.1 hypothetical protein [Myroides sp. WP-1]
MKKTILTSVSVFALLLLASCSTDSMPTEANGSAYQMNNVESKEIKNDNNASINIQIDSVSTPIQVINSASKTLENGDLGNLKDKKK